MNVLRAVTQAIDQLARLLRDLARAQICHQRISLARHLTEVRSRLSSSRDSPANLTSHRFVAQQHAGRAAAVLQICSDVTDARPGGRHCPADVARQRVVAEQHARRATAFFDPYDYVIHIRYGRCDALQRAFDIIEEPRSAREERRQFCRLRARYRRQCVRLRRFAAARSNGQVSAADDSLPGNCDDGIAPDQASQPRVDSKPETEPRGGGVGHINGEHLAGIKTRHANLRPLGHSREIRELGVVLDVACE